MIDGRYSNLEEDQGLRSGTIPPGGGKTIYFVIKSILHRAMPGDSVIVADVKADLAPILARWLRELGKEVWCINPANLHLDRTGNVEVGLYQPIIDAVYAEKDQGKLAMKLAADYAALHHPMSNEERNPYFAYGSKRVIVVAILICCYLDPADSTPTAVYRLLADPALLLSLCRKIQKYQNIKGDDLVLEDLKREARNLLHRAANNAENFSTFLEGASQKFLSLAPSGLLGDYGAGAIHSLSAIRGIGILNNELYIGQLIWNRVSYPKSPSTGRKVSRLNPEESWIRTEVPEMRLIEQPLWDNVKQLQKGRRLESTEVWQHQRPKYLFSYLLKCGCCGGGMSKMSTAHYGCSTARNKGEALCDNRRTIKQEELEHTVLTVLQESLMDPGLVEKFCEEYTAHINKLRMEQNASIHAYHAELAKLRRRDKQMVRAIMDG